MFRLYGGQMMQTVNLTISANTNNYDIRGALVALALNPTTTAYAVTLTINSGILVGDSARNGWSMITGGSSWHADSTILIVNGGFIEGYGGHAHGSAGGNAIHLNKNVLIDNTNGYIRGGGGAGGFGVSQGTGLAAAGGGGGGGGQGNPGGNAGAGDPTASGVPGADGTAGDRTNPGTGSGGGENSFYGNYGGWGGGGGAWGAPGDAGSFNASGGVGGPGGAGGKAVNLLGFVVTWQGAGGPGTSQVGGAVS